MNPDINIDDLPLELLRELSRKVRARIMDARPENGVIIEMVRAGTPLGDCGIPWSSAYRIVRRHEIATGENLPRSRNSKYASHSLQIDNRRRGERNAEIIDAYKEKPNLTIVGEQFHITRERVRQIIVRYERETGEKLPRRTAVRYVGRPRVARILWRCAGECGTSRMLTPGHFAQAGKLCGACSHCKGYRLTDALIEDTIAKVLAGSAWYPLARAAGYSRQSSFLLTRGVYTYLQRHDRHDVITRLWPRGIPHWLQKYTLKSRKIAA